MTYYVARNTYLIAGGAVKLVAPKRAGGHIHDFVFATRCNANRELAAAQAQRCSAPYL